MVAATKSGLDAGGYDDGSDGNKGNKILVGTDSPVAIATAHLTEGGAAAEAGVDTRSVNGRSSDNLRKAIVGGGDR